jgi:hypothetical protein
MPNWSNNEVIVTGNPEMIDKIEKIAFDFNRIIPPPQALVDDTEEYCTVCKSREFIDTKNHSSKCKRCDVTGNIGGRVGHMETDKERYRQLNKTEIKLAKSWRKKYGTDSWYEWNCSNWGTKWNAGEVNMKRVDKNTLTASFDTAWSPPEPIFYRLAQDYDVTVDVEARIEGDDEKWRGSYGKEV